MPTFAPKAAGQTQRNQPMVAGVYIDILQGCLHFWRGRDESTWPEWVRGALDGQRRPGRPSVVRQLAEQGIDRPKSHAERLKCPPNRPEGAEPDPFFDGGGPE